MINETNTQAIPRGEKGDDLVRYFRTAIANGRYVPGQRLVEAELTAELGVSRSLLRQVLHHLSAEGLVETIPNRGAIVKRLSFVEAVELFEIRLELESLAARRAAEKVVDREIRQDFEKAIMPIWGNEIRPSAMAYLEENELFHAAVFTAAGNGQLIALNRRLQLSLIMVQIAPYISKEVMNMSLSEHRNIAIAILDGDVAAADAAARAHLIRARQFIYEIPEYLFRK